MVVEAVVIVLVVVFCFLLFHTYSKVQFILSNAICQSTKNNSKTSYLVCIHAAHCLIRKVVIKYSS